MSIRTQALKAAADTSAKAAAKERAKFDTETAEMVEAASDALGFPLEYLGVHKVARVHTEYPRFGGTTEAVEERPFRICRMDDVIIGHYTDSGAPWEVIHEDPKGYYVSENSAWGLSLHSRTDISLEDRQARTITAVGAALRRAPKHPADALAEKNVACPTCGRGYTEWETRR